MFIFTIELRKMNFRFKTREVLVFIFVSLGIYMAFIFGFAWIYYITGSIENSGKIFTSYKVVCVVYGVTVAEL